MTILTPVAHVPHHTPCHVGRADEVDRQSLGPGFLPLLVGDLEDLVPGVDAGIVHEDVDAAHGPSDAVDHLADGRRVGEVGWGEDVTLPGQRVEDLLG